MSMASKIAEQHLARGLTRQMVEDFPLEVPEAHFQKTMHGFAREVGGRYRDGTVSIPYAPKKLTVLYNKWYDHDGPRVAFMVFPTLQGSRSKMYRSFEGPVRDSKRLFQQFEAWLAIVGAAIQRAAGGPYILEEKIQRSRKHRVASRFLCRQATLRLKVKMPDGKAMKSPSEKRMVEYEAR